MPFTSYDNPGEFFGAGYSLAANKVSLETATSGGDPLLLKLTDTDANATTGDSRQVCLALAEAMYQAYFAIAEADRPTKMQMFRNGSTTGDEGTVTYTLIFNTDGVDIGDVADE